MLAMYLKCQKNHLHQSVNKTSLGILGYLCTSEASLSAATDLGFRDKESMDGGP